MVALAVLILANMVLLVLLFGRDQGTTAQPLDQILLGHRSPTAPPTTASLTSASREQTIPTGSSASMNPTPSSVPIEPAPAERLLFATSESTAWRTTVGDCDTPGEVERSTNGGRTWTRVTRSGLAPIVRLGMDAGDKLYIIGGSGQSCSARYVAYADDGTVTAPARPGDLWFPTPSNRDQINGPRDTQAQPCKSHLVGVAALDIYQALVVCDDGVTLSTTDSGKRWREVEKLPRILAVAAGGGRYWVVGTAERCNGVVLRSLTAKNRNLGPGSARCVPAAGIASGEVALDVSGEAIWVWAGDDVQVSTNNGSTWN
jgi:hypothetical protein